jgi:hypothetical protein
MSDPVTVTNLDGLPSRATSIVMRYGERKYAMTAKEGFEVITRVRALLRDGVCDVVPVAHEKGLAWLSMGPGIRVAFDEREGS